MQTIQLRIEPNKIHDESYIRNCIAKKLGIEDDSFRFKWRKKSIDARKSQILYNATLDVFAEHEIIPENYQFNFTDVSNAPEVTIIGAGPAGLFAGLRCLELGLRPVIFERGKDVRSRRRDLADLNRGKDVNPESNYCFGEGGAGTYSDGKLYTRSKKRGDIDRALEIFVYFGASDAILVDAHPHIGTNKLPQIIIAMRERIISCGGEVHFGAKLTDIHVADGKVNGIDINSSYRKVKHLILATGHSARDIFKLLYQKKIKIEAKPFALGVRIEHTQELIDRIQYHGRLNDEYLPPASYSLVSQVDGRGVYSFCMCPGGIIAPCATEPGQVVTNGWSPSKRNNVYSNSGIVVAVFPQDFEEFENDPFVCLNFQEEVERKCFEIAGGMNKIPAQRILDFIQGKVSEHFPRSSYQPGIMSVDLNTVLPPMIADRLRKAFIDFGKKMNGYLTNDAVLHAPESRTSSPVSIPRDPYTCQHVEVSGLYPCGEGAGYAGGIISAAIDGMKCVNAVFETING
jgi:uncharacterized FAD-dependent dehydrogenase